MNSHLSSASSTWPVNVVPHLGVSRSGSKNARPVPTRGRRKFIVHDGRRLQASTRAYDRRDCMRMRAKVDSAAVAVSSDDARHSYRALAGRPFTDVYNAVGLCDAPTSGQNL